MHVETNNMLYGRRPDHCADVVCQHLDACMYAACTYIRCSISALKAACSSVQCSYYVTPILMIITNHVRSYILSMPSEEGGLTNISKQRHHASATAIQYLLHMKEEVIHKTGYPTLQHLTYNCDSPSTEV